MAVVVETVVVSGAVVDVADIVGGAVVVVAIVVGGNVVSGAIVVVAVAVGVAVVDVAGVETFRHRPALKLCSSTRDVGASAFDHIICMPWDRGSSHERWRLAYTMLKKVHTAAKYDGERRKKADNDKEERPCRE